MSRRVLQGTQFNIQHHGPWYHGGPRADFDQVGAPARFNMPGYLHGYTYATTSKTEAEKYAWDSYDSYIEKHPEHEGLPEVKPTVYELAPSRSWEPDPHGGSGGWYDGFSRQDTKDYLQQGGADPYAEDGVKVGFPNPVKIRDRHEVDTDSAPPPRQRRW